VGEVRPDIGGLLNSAALKYGLDPSLLARVARQESGGNPSARSPAGAIGVMQLMPGTARDLGVDPTDPAQNIDGGARYLKQQMDAFGSPELALAAYNAGPGAVRKHGGIPPYRETRNYVSSIVGGAGSERMVGSDGGFDGADIFGGSSASTPMSQPGGFDGSDIFTAPAAPAPKVDVGGMDNGGGLAKAADVRALAPRKDQGLGFVSGLMKPLDNTAMAFSTAADHIGGLVGNPHAGQDFDRMFGGKTATELADQRAAYVQDQRAKGVAPGGLGTFAGNMVGTIPAMIASKNPVVQGALSGAMLTDNRDVPGVLKDAGLGAVTGAAGHVLMGAAGKALKGGSKEVRKLLQEGVQLTPGQVLGGVAQRVEDKLTSVPWVGDVIAGKRAATIPQFNRAAANDVLSSVGKRVPDNVEAGHDAVKFAGDTLSAGYNKLLTPLTVRLDKGFANHMASLAPDIASLAPADQAQVQAILKEQVARRLGAGPVTGQALKDVESYLTRTISKFYKNPDKAEIADVLSDVQHGFREMIARQNPQAAKDLAAHNLAWAKLMRLQSAAASAVDGVASPNQLKQSVVRGAGQRFASRGEGLMQDLANAAAKVLPQRVGDSGTAGRALQMTIPGAVAAGVTAPLLPLYSRTGQKAIGALFGGARPSSAKQMADVLAAMKTPLLVGSSALTVGATKSPDERRPKR
jgi:hypothetical protein